ncbi:Ycf66 family protein [Pleurocapsales cyanobacterium LEGE 10410]|nr:Ycf66 family protein [Pleurocapsales cyanobacterium LEGE 10410]
MLSYALAIVVASSSLVLFLTAFFMSDIHRQDDFLWSAVGLFYALILWFCARNITGAVLLGQTAATGLLVVYGWQTLKLRKAIANPAQAAEISNFSVLQSINNLLKRNKSKTKPAVTPTESPTMPKVTEQEIAIPQAAETKTTPAKDEVSSDSTQDRQTAPKTVDTNISLPEDQPVKETTTVEVDDANSQPAATTDNKAQQEHKHSATQPQKTSNMSEAEVDKTDRVQPQPVVRDNQIETSSVSGENAKTQPETKVKPAEKIASDSQEQIKMPKVDVEPASTTVDPEITEPEKIPQKKASSLDSLETVEVAEVLEAVPEDVSSDGESDDSNIIEVTTTEINITTETKTIDPDRDDHPDSEQK